MGQILPFKRPKRRSKRNRGGPPFLSFVTIGLVGALAAAGYVLLNDRLDEVSTSESPLVSASFVMCNSPPHRDCVIDGDTFYLDRNSIRIADINAPEIGEPECAYEASLGASATRRLLALLNVGPFELASYGDRDFDQYGRLLRVVERDGRSLGMILVSEGLAEPWTGSRRSWC